MLVSTYPFIENQAFNPLKMFKKKILGCVLVAGLLVMTQISTASAIGGDGEECVFLGGACELCYTDGVLSSDTCGEYETIDTSIYTNYDDYLELTGFYCEEEIFEDFEGGKELCETCYDGEGYALSQYCEVLEVDYYSFDEWEYVDYDYDWYNDDYDYDYDYGYEDWDDYNWDTEEWDDWEWDDGKWEEEDWDDYWYDYEWDEGEWDDMALDYYDLYYEIEDLFWMAQEIEMIYQEYGYMGVEMPADVEQELARVSADLEEILSNEKISPLYDLARDAIEYSDEYYDYGYEQQTYLDEAWNVDYSADLEEIFDILDSFWKTYPWGVVDYAWQNLDVYWFEGDMRAEIEWILGDLDIAETFVEALTILEIDDPFVIKAITNLKPLAPEARVVLEKMLEKIDAGLDDPYEMNEYWDILDGLEMAFMDNLDILSMYLEENEDVAEQLLALIPEEAVIVESWAYGDPYYEEEYNFEDDYNKYYGDIQYDYVDDFFMENLDEAMMDEIFRTVSSVLMEELAVYLEDEIADAIIANVMNSVGVFGEELANSYLDNQAAVLKKMDFDFHDVQYYEKELEELANRTKETVIPDAFRFKVEELWEDVRGLVEFGASEEKIWSVLDNIRIVLDQVDHENIFGENPVEFYDVEFDQDPEWYWDDVMTTRKEGCVNGYSDDNGLTGYFGPGDQVTYAQALKMTMCAAGIGPVPTDGAPWYEGYLIALDEMGLDRLNRGTYNDWNVSAPRGDIVKMVNDIFGLDSVDYMSGTFPDISADDPLSGDAMASYLAGIFTGAGETGNLNPNAFIDRASFAKVINVGSDYLSNQNFTDTLKSFNEKL